MIETDGGGDILSGSIRAIGTAVSLNKGATLNLTDAQITTTGIYTAGIDLKEQSSMTLTGESSRSGELWCPDAQWRVKSNLDRD